MGGTAEPKLRGLCWAVGVLTKGLATGAFFFFHFVLSVSDLSDSQHYRMVDDSHSATSVADLQVL